jgi:hypothetical protein|nr:MAG TPA: hypothetical protein [Bacteriophage sp.]
MKYLDEMVKNGGPDIIESLLSERERIDESLFIEKDEAVGCYCVRQDGSDYYSVCISTRYSPTIKMYMDGKEQILLKDYVQDVIDKGLIE